MKLTDAQLAKLESHLASARFHDAACEREWHAMAEILGNDDEAQDWCLHATTAEKTMTVTELMAHIDECRAATAAIDREDRR